MILYTACSFFKQTSWSLNWILFCSQSFTSYPPKHFLQQPSPCQTMTVLLGLPLKSDWKPHDPLTLVFCKSAKSAAYGQSQPTLCMNISWDPWTTMFIAVSEYLSCWIERNASLCSVCSVHLWIEEPLTLQWRTVHVCICVCVCIKYFHTMYSVNGLPHTWSPHRSFPPPYLHSSTLSFSLFRKWSLSLSQKPAGHIDLLEKQVGNLQTSTSPSHLQIQSNPLVSFQALWQTTCCDLPFLTAHPLPFSHAVFFFHTIPLSQSPTFSGIPWVPTGHTNQGNR